MACYDRMIPEVTLIHLQSLGLPEEAVKCSVVLNHNMCHHVKTTAGVSREHYRHKPENKKYGEGQGKLPHHQTGCSKFLQCSVHYIDCTYLDQKDQQNETPTRIRNRLQSIAQMWENLIFGSGGR
eukprot:11012200-Ditylum_brightwellii.AAC.1